MASGVAMATLFVLTIPLARCRQPLPAIRPAIGWSLALVTSVAVGVQAGAMQLADAAAPIPAERLVDISPEEFVDDAKSLGPRDAPVTIVMFADLWCPACRAAHGSLIDFQGSYPDDVRIAFRHLPLLNLPGHQFSGPAAALSEIAAEQGKFWPFIAAVFGSKEQKNRVGYLQLLRDLGIDSSDAEKRIANARDPATTTVWRDLTFAERLGVSATPTFIVLAPGQPPRAASMRGLPRVLNSPTVKSHLANLQLDERASSQLVATD
jgi:protein-disulfide isomerase